MGFDRKLAAPASLDEKLVICPFSFITRGASVPDTFKGAIISSVAGVKTLVRTSAGLFTFTVTDKPFEVLAAIPGCVSGAAEDTVIHIDASLATTTGVVTVRVMTGATPTDPATGTTISGVLYMHATDRVTST